MSNNEIENIQPDIEIETIIKDGNLHDVITDTAQLATDIPVIGTLVKGMKFISKVQEKIFANKIQHFLYELKDISQEKRQKKINEVNQSNKLQYSIGLVLLDQLQRIDMNYKPQLLGKLFASFCNEIISLDEYLRLTYIVENAFFRDLQTFKQYSINGLYKSDFYNALNGGELMCVDYVKIMNVQLGENSLGEPVLPTGEENYPELSEFGKKLLSIM